MKSAEIISPNFRRLSEMNSFDLISEIQKVSILCGLEAFFYMQFSWHEAYLNLLKIGDVLQSENQKRLINLMREYERRIGLGLNCDSCEITDFPKYRIVTRR